MDRAYSWYNYCRRSYNECRPFETFLEEDRSALKWGLYYAHLTRYLQACPTHPLLVLVFEECLRYPATELSKLAAFLSLSCPIAPSEDLLHKKVNTSDPPRLRRSFALAHRVGDFLLHHDLNWPVQVAKRLGIPELFGRSSAPPPLQREIRARLESYYAEDVARLGEMLGRDFSLWRSGSEL